MLKEMNIIYLITILAIHTLFMLIPKSEKKQNLILWIALTTILVLSWNILICTIITFIGISCTLLNLSICNTIGIALLVVPLARTKKVQKYYVKAIDIIVTILLLILVIFTAYKQYGFPFNIKYQITDASSHYYYAEQFYKNSTLLYKGTTEDFFGVFGGNFSLPGAYINEGILFKIFDYGQISRINLFIIFDLFILYISGILFYYLLNTHIAKQSKKLQILVIIFSMMYMLGYQINSMLYGFVYLSFALDIIIALILVLTNYEKEEISQTYALPILSLLSFGIFFSYAYFIPIIYIAIIVNTIIQSITNNEKLISEQNIMKIICIIINPLILGATYFIILPKVSGIRNEISSIITNGAIYENYITNLIPFIPIIIGGIIIAIKNKKKEINISTILLIMAIIFVTILFIGNSKAKVSKYYCFKAYYIIWPLVIHNAFLALNNILTDKNKTLKIITYAYTGIYILAIVTSTLVLKSNIGINDIFYHNAELIQSEKCILKNEELKTLEKVKSSIENKQLYVVTSKKIGRMKWMYVLYNNHHIYSDNAFGNEINIEKWLKKEEKYYLAYYEDYNKFQDKQEPEQNNENYKIIYNDEYAFILEKK